MRDPLVFPVLSRSLLASLLLAGACVPEGGGLPTPPPPTQVASAPSPTPSDPTPSDPTPSDPAPSDPLPAPEVVTGPTRVHQAWPTAISPGMEVEISGEGLAADTEVLFGSTPAAKVVVKDSTWVVATAPEGVGVEELTVRSREQSAQGDSVSFNDGFVEANEGLGFGGPVRQIVVTRERDPRVFAATAAGLYRSDDLGVTWRQRSLGLHSASVFAIAPSPVDPMRLFLCTEDGRLFTTRNHGEAWKPLAQPAGLATCFDIAAHPTDPNRVFAFLGGWFAECDVDGNCQRSADGGSKLSAEGAHLHRAGWGVVTRSFTTGESWTAMPELYFSGVSASPASPGRVYACADASDALWRSEDFGRTWTDTGVRGVWEVRADPTLPDRVYVWSGSGLRVSDDRGATFRSSSPPSTVASIAIDPADSSRVFAATGAGPYRLEAGQWVRHSDGMRAFAVRGIALAPSMPGRVYLAVSEHGLFRSDDRGGLWTRATASGLFGAVYSVAVDPSNARTILVGTSNGYFRSTDAGESFSRLASLYLGNWLRGIAFDGAAAFAPGHDGIYASSDGGASFVLKSAPLGTWIYSTRTFGDRLFVVSEDGLFVSTDAGASFTSWVANPDVVGVDVASTGGDLWVAFDRSLHRCADGACVRVPVPESTFPQLTSLTAAGSTLFLGRKQGLFRSDDGGSTWVEQTHGLDRFEISTVVPLDPSRPDDLLVGTSALGVFRTKRTP